jgi:hypothetical protein
VFAVNVDPSIAGPDAPRGFHPEARYEFRIDGGNDQIPELTYRLASIHRRCGWASVCQAGSGPGSCRMRILNVLYA